MPDTSRGEAPDRRNGQRVPPVALPGPAGSTEAANGNGEGDHEMGGRWRSVRLRLGSGARARREQGEEGREDAAEAPAGGRRRVLLAALGVLAAVVIVVQFVLLVTDDNGPSPRRTVSVPSLTAAPPASTRVTPPALRFHALKGAGAATGTARLGNAGHLLALTVRTDVPGKVYGVVLTSHGAHGRPVLLSRGGRATHTLRIGWRGLARYRTLGVFVRVPAARHHRAKGGKGKHRAPRRRLRMIMRLSVNRLVRDSGVRLIG